MTRFRLALLLACATFSAPAFAASTAPRRAARSSSPIAAPADTAPNIARPPIASPSSKALISSSPTCA